MGLMPTVRQCLNGHHILSKSPLVMEFLDKPGMEKEQSKLKKLLLEYNKKLLL